MGSIKAGGGAEVWRIAQETGRVLYDEYVLVFFINSLSSLCAFSAELIYLTHIQTPTHTHTHRSQVKHQMVDDENSA